MRELPSLRRHAMHARAASASRPPQVVTAPHPHDAVCVPCVHGAQKLVAVHGCDVSKRVARGGRKRPILAVPLPHRAAMDNVHHGERIHMVCSTEAVTEHEVLALGDEDVPGQAVAPMFAVHWAKVTHHTS